MITKQQKESKDLEKVRNWAIRAQRAQYGLSQAQMGEIIGDTAETYSRKERGEQEFTITDAIAFKEHFGLKSIDEIFPE
jgi:DNA-binding XRE family transcriptional regulator